MPLSYPPSSPNQHAIPGASSPPCQENTRFFIWTGSNQRYADCDFMHLVVTDTEVEVYSANWEREEAEQYNRAYIERYFRTQNAESRQWTEVTGQGFSLVMQGYAGDPLRDPSFQSYILPFSPLLMKPPKTNHRIGVPKNKLP